MNTGKWLTVAALVVVSTTALAQPGKGKGNGKDNDRDNGRDNGRETADVQVSINFNSNQRDSVSSYFRDRRDNDRSSCPPGLAKKNNGCQPPGQAKRYQVGRPLGGIGYGPVPDGILIHIGLPPSGHTYGMVDGDLLLIALGTLLVIDAIDGF
ncbi:MAG: hypothetical protein V4603_04845 [Pseudomonadota bacterium]